MKRIAFAALLLAACSEPQETEEHRLRREARETAEVYYDHLINGRASAVVDMMQSREAMYPEDLPEYEKLFAKHADHLRKARGGLSAVRCVADSLPDSLTSQVFVELSFCDSTTEKVMLSLVRRNGRWLLR